MAKYLDKDGLSYLWSEITAYVAQKAGGNKTSMVSITLTADGWTDNQQTVEAAGILADETKQLIQPMPAASSQAAYYDAGILCSGQDADSLTFSTDTSPTEDLTVYVAVTEIGGDSSGNL